MYDRDSLITTNLVMVISITTQSLVCFVGYIMMVLILEETFMLINKCGTTFSENLVIMFDWNWKVDIQCDIWDDILHHPTWISKSCDWNSKENH